MTPSKFSDRTKREQQQLQDKESRLALVKKNYSRFGTKIVTIMMSYMSTEQGMAKLFKTLNMPRGIMMPPADQHNMVVNWLTAHGERRFLELHEPTDKKKSQHPAPEPYTPKPIITEDLKKPMYSPFLSQQAQLRSEQLPHSPQGSQAFQPTPLVQPIPLSPSPSVSKPSPAAQPSSAAPSSPVPQPSPISQPSSQVQRSQSAAVPPSSQSPSPAKAPSSLDKPGLKEKIWPEGERRNGKERRQAKDRRSEVEMVFKNKRFGGERRSGKERRKNWKPPA